MNIYVLESIVDNPYYEGLRADASTSGLFDTWPEDWIGHIDTWEPRRLINNWNPPTLRGNVKSYNDFPAIDSVRPAFSSRAVEQLGNLLTSTGELLPVHHKRDIYYFYNCTVMTNLADINKSQTIKVKNKQITTTDNLALLPNIPQDLVLFKIRTQLTELFCTQTFVDKVAQLGLFGMLFVPIWPLPNGVSFNQASFAANEYGRSLRPPK